MGSSSFYSNFILFIMIGGGVALLYCLLHEGVKRWVAGGLALACAITIVWYFLPFRIPVSTSDRSSVTLVGKTGPVELTQEQKREIRSLCNELTYARQIGESGLHTAVGTGVSEYIELDVIIRGGSMGLWLATDEDGFSQYHDLYGMNTRGDRVRNPKALIAYLKSIMPGDAFQGVEPVETVIDIDLETARDMIIDWDRNMAWLSTQKSMSGEDTEAFGEVMSKIFPGEGGTALDLLFTDVGTTFSPRLERSDRLFYPTLFHQGVELVSAQEVRTEVYNVLLEGMVLSRDELIIRTAYKGEDEGLKDWYREYVFTRSGPDEEWRFYHFNGMSNIWGEDFDSAGLALREDTIESPLQ